MWFYQVVLCLCTIVGNLYALQPSLQLTKVWGPGLEPHNVVMPARYFFIQAIDQNNNRLVINNNEVGFKKIYFSIRHSLKDPFQVIVEGSTSKKIPCRIWTHVLDRKDGVYIVRYKVYEQCSYLKINIKYNNEPVAKSPYVIDKYVYPDTCYCPKEKLSDIINTWQCGNIPQQILSDIEIFDKINWDKLRPKIIKEFNKPHSVSLCHYVIKNNQVFRKCYGKYVGFNMFSDNILLSLARKVKLPDLEFFINLGDWPLSLKSMADKYPIFSWCGSTDSHDIVMPTYELTEASLEIMGRVMLDMLSVQGNVADVFQNRESKLFWRGRDANRQRLNLITISKEHPDLFNASLTNFFFFRDEEEIYGPKTEHVSFFKFFDYKYQLAIDGTVATYRMPFLLGGGSLIFKPRSKYYEHFYSNLEPNVHYVPVETDLSDLVEKINLFKENDAEAQLIAQNGQTFANDYLLPKEILCYYMHLLNKLSNMVTSTVTILDDMSLIDQKNDDSCDCLKTSEHNVVKDEF